MPEPTSVPVSQDYLVSRLSRHVDIANSHLLEIGCGSGRLAEIVAPKVRLYTGIDISAKAIRKAESLYGLHPNVYFRHGNAESLDTGEVRFDVVLYGLSFNMIGNKEKSLDEASRVLKPEGIVAVLEPREDAINWLDPLLRWNSPEFRPDLLERKLADIRLAADILCRQDILSIVEYNENHGISQNLWILRKKA